MDWLALVQEALPPMRADEPARLRRDIADELADHLACATQRELKHAGDEAAARRAALERFGDPRSLARRLWFDAMKEAIMKDRIMLGAMVLLSAACIAIAAFAWVSFRESRETNRATVETLRKIAAAGSQPQPRSDLATATIHIVQSSADGTPVAEAKVELEGRPFDPNRIDRVAGKTGADGCARISPIRPGVYDLSVEIPSEGLVSSASKATLFAMAENVETVVAPTLPKGTVSFRLNLPGGLQGVPLFFLCSFSGSVNANGREWRPDFYSALTLGADGTRYDSRSLRSIEDLRTPSPSSGSGSYEREYRWDFKRAEAQPPLSAPVQEYRCERLWICGPDAAPKSSQQYPYVRYAECEAPDSVFHVEAGANTEWTIHLPEKEIRRAGLTIACIRGEIGIPMNATLADAAPGLIEGVWLVSRDCTILNYMPNWSHGEVDHLEVANNDGGVRCLIAWPAIPPEEAAKADRQYFLALYSGTTTLVEPPGRIQVHEILSDWPENVSWNTQPATDDSPASTADVVRGIGWRLFDVTLIVRAQAAGERAPHGVELRFDREDRSGEKKDWSGYQFTSREGMAFFRPVLLAVEAVPQP
ncbi:MAG: DNRLRE domain-containing protein [Candidatus Sumerlaeota bacterium]|nr:DNRLRE domain-containing protein [Candidatus Sumerlaeota bacterium]